jgi:hypothetical protein
MQKFYAALKKRERLPKDAQSTWLEQSSVELSSMLAVEDVYAPDEEGSEEDQDLEDLEFDLGAVGFLGHRPDGGVDVCAVWGQGSFTSFTREDAESLVANGSVQTKRMIARCARCRAVLDMVDRCLLAEVTEREREGLFPELFGTLRASLELSVTKGIASKFTGNPRSSKPAVGELMVSLTIGEAAWRLFHLAVDPASCVWTRTHGGGHRSDRQKWGNPIAEFCSSYFRYELHTCIGLHRVLDCFRLLADIANGDDGDVFSPFPQGFITITAAFKPVLGGVVDGTMLQAPAFPESVQGERGTIIGNR